MSNDLTKRLIYLGVTFGVVMFLVLVMITFPGAYSFVIIVVLILLTFAIFVGSIRDQEREARKALLTNLAAETGLQIEDNAYFALTGEVQGREVRVELAENEEDKALYLVVPMGWKSPERLTITPSASFPSTHDSALKTRLQATEGLTKLAAWRRLTLDGTTLLLEQLPDQKGEMTRQNLIQLCRLADVWEHDT